MQKETRYGDCTFPSRSGCSLNMSAMYRPAEHLPGSGTEAIKVQNAVMCMEERSLLHTTLSSGKRRKRESISAD